MEVAVIADDLTGAADTGMQFARAGYRTAVAFRGAEMDLGDLDAVALDTDSRTMPPGPAAERVSEAVSAMRNARILYKKLDSTLRGNVVAELAAALEASGCERAIFALSFPDAGRATIGGVQLVHGVPVHQTPMRDDPKTPVTEGHVPTLLSGVFMVGVLEAEDLRDSGPVRRALSESRCVVADARSNADLEALVRAVPDPSEVLWAGSAGLALALAGRYPGLRAGETPAALAPARKVLVIVGSLSASSREQLRRLVERHGAVAVPVAGHRSVERAVAVARAALTRGRCAILHSPEKRRSPGGGPVVALLAEAAASLSGEGPFDALVMTGGSTAVAVARRLGASGMRLDGEVEAGVPLGTLICPSPYRVVTKAGGFGNPDTLVKAVETLAGKE
ncbi:MAG: four-carbon acid sugar kinase family protein [Rubrobacteraceae bacterium]